MTGLVVGGFAGPGGWCTGARIAGHTGPMVGIDLSADACRTAMVGDAVPPLLAARVLEQFVQSSAREVAA